jgi:hypothetical protein
METSPTLPSGNNLESPRKSGHRYIRIDKSRGAAKRPRAAIQAIPFLAVDAIGGGEPVFTKS